MTEEINNDDWYKNTQYYINIYLDKLTNDILDKVEPIPEKYNNLIWNLYYVNDALDILYPTVITPIIFYFDFY